MKIAMATANFYKIPFDRTLDIIAQAGYEYIELDGYWKGGEWEIAQHLKNMKPNEVLNAVKASGLKIASYHDLGGVITENDPSIINPWTFEYLSLEDIPCVIFHVPHCKTPDENWWNGYKGKVMEDLKSLKEKFTGNKIITVENILPVTDYQVPLINPHEMLKFVTEADINVTIDTTHYGQSDVDILEAGKVLKNKVSTLHLSDYKDGKAHVYIGDGDLDLKNFYKTLNLNQLYLTTIECDIPHTTHQEAIENARKAKTMVEEFCGL